MLSRIELKCFIVINLVTLTAVDEVDCGKSTVDSQKGEGVADGEQAVGHGIEARGDGERQPTLKAKVLVFFRLLHASINPARSAVGSDLSS